MIYLIIRQQLYCCIDESVYLKTSATVIPPCYKKVGRVNQPRVEQSITIRSANFLNAVIQTPVKRHKNSFIVFSKYSNAA